MKKLSETENEIVISFSKEELGIIAGALYCANSEDIKCFVDKYKYPCSGFNFDEIAECQEKLSEEINKLIENR